MNAYEIYNNVYEECNKASQFQNCVQNIVSETKKELEVIKMTYKESAQPMKIKECMNKAQKQLNKHRETFVNLLSNELQKKCNAIPNNIDIAQYDSVKLKVLEWELSSMSNQDLLQYASDNCTDRVAVTAVKAYLMNNSKTIEDATEKQNIIVAARQLKVQTKQSIVNEVQEAFNSLDVSQLYPGMGVGSTAMINSYGNFDDYLCAECGLEKIKAMPFKNDEPSAKLNNMIGINEQQFK